jgi:type IX secretion system PorP/SprF family membrane protein
MNKITKLLLTAVTLVTVMPLFAQDIHFTQAYMAPLSVNPGLAGLEYDMRGIVNYRNQWRSVTAPFVTYAASYDMNFAKPNQKTGFWAAGVNLFGDKAGDSEMQTYQGSISGAYHLFLNDKNTLGIGTQVGFFQRSVNLNNLSWSNQYDGTNFDASRPSMEPVTAGSEIIFAPDFITGITWSYKKTDRYAINNEQLIMTGGISVQHLNAPSYAAYEQILEDRLHLRWVGHYNALIGLPNTAFSLQPMAIFMMQGPNQMLFLGTNVVYRVSESSGYSQKSNGATISFGGFYRYGDSFAFTTMLEFGQYAIGMSYDFNYSPLNIASNGNGAFEIALRYVSPSPFGGKSSARFQ